MVPELCEEMLLSRRTCAPFLFVISLEAPIKPARSSVACRVSERADKLVRNARRL